MDKAKIRKAFEMMRAARHLLSEGLEKADLQKATYDDKLSYTNGIAALRQLDEIIHKWGWN